MRTKSISKTQTGQASKRFFFKRSPASQSFFESRASNKFFGAVAETIYRKCDECANEEQVQRKSNDATATTHTHVNPHTFLNKLDSSGQSLPRDQQHFFEQRMNYDFGEVKIHTDKEAAQSSSAFNAQAYTYKNHIVFNKNKYQPETIKGKELLAHELSHVIQQSPTEKLYRQHHPETEWIPPDVGPGVQTPETTSPTLHPDLIPTDPVERERWRERRQAAAQQLRVTLLELVNGRDTARLNASLRGLTRLQATDLVWDEGFIQSLHGQFSGTALWSIFSILLHRAFGDPRLDELALAILQQQAQTTTDLIEFSVTSGIIDMIPLRLLRISIPQVFDGNRLLPQMLELLNSPVVGGAISLDYREAHYEQNAQGQSQIRQFDSHSTPRFRITSTEMRVMVRMNFVQPGSGLPFYFSGGNLPGILAGWLNAIGQVWNNQFVLVNPTNRISLVFVPMVGQSGSEAIEIHTNDSDSCQLEGGRANSHCWFTSASGQTVAHEFGHLIGATDEYNLPASASEIPPSFQLSEEDTSLTTVEGIRRHQGRQGGPLTARSGGTLPSSIMAGTSTEVHVWHLRRLVNAINATLPAGLRFIIQRTH